ncbi:MAG: hypothetical protein H6735_10690 [Alphaproteobacteria bacterium]|nr:hypothetical protein [Alphaproteobacteria bacterium]
MFWSLVACSEVWLASDRLAHPFTGPGEFALRLTVTPEAWPDGPFDGAVRVGFSGSGELSSLDEDLEVVEVGTNSLNAVDVFDRCPHDEDCEVDLHYLVRCQTCEGRVTADAFLSVHAMGGHDSRDGSLVLAWLEP